MKRKLYALLFVLTPVLVSAQKTNPAPYCQSEYNTNYNMFQAISVGAYTHSFGPMGSIGTPNTYLYVDTAKLPAISKSSSTSIFLDFYSVADVEPAYFGLWIDYDQSKTFEASELVFHNENTLKKKLPSSPSSGISLPISLKANALAKNGKTRMRIVRSQKQSDGSGPYDATFKLDPCNIKSSAGGIFGCTYDFDVEIVGVSAIDEELLKQQLSLSPNPATDKIVLLNTSIQKINGVAVFDLSGKQLLETKTSLEINISQFASGVYFAKVTMENGAVLPMKFVKD